MASTRVTSRVAVEPESWMLRVAVALERWKLHLTA
jgi:hypothetical protein